MGHGIHGGLHLSNGELDRGVAPALQPEIHIYLTFIEENKDKSPNPLRYKPKQRISIVRVVPIHLM
jgi:hypothetical protein